MSTPWWICHVRPPSVVRSDWASVRRVVHVDDGPGVARRRRGTVQARHEARVRGQRVPGPGHATVVGGHRDRAQDRLTRHPHAPQPRGAAQVVHHRRGGRARPPGSSWSRRSRWRTRRRPARPQRTRSPSHRRPPRGRRSPRGRDWCAQVAPPSVVPKAMGQLNWAPNVETGEGRRARDRPQRAGLERQRLPRPRGATVAGGRRQRDCPRSSPPRSRPRSTGSRWRTASSPSTGAVCGDQLPPKFTVL